MPRKKVGQEVGGLATVRAWAVEGREVATIVHRVMLAKVVDKAGEEVEARATVRAWVAEGQEVATIVHRVMLAQDADKAGDEVEARATVRAWGAERQEVAIVVHRVMLAKVVDKAGEEVEATAEVCVMKKARVVVKVKTLAEDRVVVGIAGAEQAVLVVIVSQVRTVAEVEARVTAAA
jgi:hypothetical protein